MYFVYVLKHSDTKQIYIGKTSNIKQRLREHNAGRQTATVRKTGGWNLVYTEIYKNKSDADDREIKLKQHGRAKQELLKRIQASLS